MEQTEVEVARNTTVQSPAFPRARPKIAIVYHFLPHYRRAVFSKLLESPNFDFDIYFGENKVTKNIKTEEAIPNTVKLPVRRIGPFYFQGGLFKIFPRGRYDAIIYLGQYNILTYWVAAARDRIRNTPVLFWTHGWTQDDTGIKNIARKFFYKLADSLLLYGEYGKTIGVKKGFKTEEMKVIHNSLDYAKQKSIRHQLESEEEQNVSTTNFRELANNAGGVTMPYFLCIARLTQSLRIDQAIEALKVLRDETGRKIPLVLIGDGEMRQPLKLLAERLKVDVAFLGAIYDETLIGPWVYNARAVVSPGKVGLTAIHSLAYGTPVITHDNFGEQGPEFETIKPGRTGDFFRQHNVTDLANTMLAWLDKPKTSTERTTAIEVVEKSYTPERQVELIEEELWRVLRTKNANSFKDPR